MNKNRKLSILAFKIIPKSLISRIMGSLTRIPLPGGIMKRIINTYSRSYGIKDEYIIPESGFRNFNEFFTRRLEDGARKIDTSPGVIVSPVDARIDQYGEINDSTLVQAKGLHYSINELVPSETSKKFMNGSFMTLYLSPSDYHRIHSPVKGKIIGYFNIPGKLFTVQEYMTKGLDGLFVRNERVISYIESDSGFVGVCKVGALNVGRISLSYENVITNRTFRRRKEHFFENGNHIPVEAGGELGRFNLGSTVILLFQEGAVTFNNFKLGCRVKIGEKIGSKKRHKKQEDK